jgi:cathepsin E
MYLNHGSFTSSVVSYSSISLPLFNQANLTLTADAQIWPQNLNSVIGGIAGNVYLIVNDIGTPTGSGLDFTLGMAVLQRFYSVFDSGNNQVGFAETNFTNAEINFG